MCIFHKSNTRGWVEISDIFTYGTKCMIPRKMSTQGAATLVSLGLSNTSLGLLGFYCNLYLKNFNCFQVDQQPKSRIFLQMLYCWLQFVVNSYMEEYFNWFLVYTQHSSADEIIQKFNMCLCKNSIDWVCWGEFCPWF